MSASSSLQTHEHQEATHSRRRWILPAVIACALVLVLVRVLFFGTQGFRSEGECRTSADCPAGQECMDTLLPEQWKPWWARFKTYRTCEIRCERQDDCPPGYSCALTDDGPGPGRHCTR